MNDTEFNNPAPASKALDAFFKAVAERLSKQIAKEHREFLKRTKAWRLDASGNIIGTVGDENDPAA